jgi:hypothetical protein
MFEVVFGKIQVFEGCASNFFISMNYAPSWRVVGLNFLSSEHPYVITNCY